MLKVVLDANLFVSATLTESGHPALIVDAWREGKFELIISTSILTENADLGCLINQRIL